MKEVPSHGFGPEEQQAYRVAWLIAGFITKTLTDKENSELDNWVTASIDNQRLFEQLIEERSQAAWIKTNNSFDRQAALQRIKNKVSFAPVKKKAVMRSLRVYIAAASVLLAIMTGFLLLKTTKQSPEPPVLVKSNEPDIAPGHDRAVLTLSDGRKLPLENIQPGKLISQGTSSLKNDSGWLSYKADPRGLVSPVDSYNTLDVPAGGQYKLVLPDGTRVWLNAASSLRYPTAFNAAIRRVELTGEGYFEVAKDPMFPFEVVARGNVIRVLGTHFNVNAYTNEPVLKVALEEGSVQVNNHSRLKPGQLALLKPDGTIETVAADIEAELAWKNNQFIFHQTPVADIMRQISRWYNCDIFFNTSITAHFNATLSRNTPVSKLLHYLEGTGAVHFQVEDKQIKVMP